MSKLIDLTGQDFGYWHVLYRAENNKIEHARWLYTSCTRSSEQLVLIRNV